MLVFSYLAVTWVAYFLLVYALYWVFRTFKQMFNLLLCFFHVLKDTEINWWARCLRLERGAGKYLETLLQEQRAWYQTRHSNYDSRLIWSRLQRRAIRLWEFFAHPDTFRILAAREDEIVRLRRYAEMPAAVRIKPMQIHHLVIVPTYKEGMNVLIPTLEHLMDVNYDLERVHILIAGEGADKTFAEVRKAILKLVGTKLPNLYFNVHQLTVGEIAGKSSNQTSALKWFETHVFASLGITKEQLVVTSLDADYRVYPEYFADLTFNYVTDPDRKFHIYQTIPMFFNNIWKVNLFSRINSTLGTQIQMARQLDYRQNRNFSSYAAAYATIKQAGYWYVDVIQEDSRLFWKIYFAFGHRVRVEPLFLPVFGDAVFDRSYAKSLQSLYDQMRRWAWGASDVPFVMVQAWDHPEIPLWSRVRSVWDVISNYFNWTTMPVILAIGTLLPFYLNHAFAKTVMGYNLPVFTSRLLTLTSVIVVVFLLVDARLAPRKPKEWQPWRRMLTYLQWMLMPIMGILFSALPAIDAQTKLLRGKKLQYIVTKKGI